MAVRKGCVVFPTIVLVEVIFMSQNFAFVAVDGARGRFYRPSDDIVYTPFLEEARGVGSQL
jgi:hypothetical protein